MLLDIEYVQQKSRSKGEKDLNNNCVMFYLNKMLLRYSKKHNLHTRDNTSDISLFISWLPSIIVIISYFIDFKVIVEGMPEFLGGTLQQFSFR